MTARLELQRLQTEHQRLRDAVEKACSNLRGEPVIEPVAEAALSELEAALLWRVGDDGQDSVLKAVGG